MQYYNVPSLEASGLALFKSIVFNDEHLKRNMTAAILAMIEEVLLPETFFVVLINSFSYITAGA